MLSTNISSKQFSTKVWPNTSYCNIIYNWCTLYHSNSIHVTCVVVTNNTYFHQIGRFLHYLVAFKETDFIVSNSTIVFLVVFFLHSVIYSYQYGILYCHKSTNFGFKHLPCYWENSVAARNVLVASSHIVFYSPGSYFSLLYSSVFFTL